jgi:hypothetical protein
VVCMSATDIRSVEAQGRTIEELEWVYNQPNLKIDKVVVQADGTVSEKVAEA